MSYFNIYSLDSYKEVKTTPIREFYIDQKIYLVIGSCFSTKEHYTELWDLENAKKIRIDQTDGDYLDLHGRRIWWGGSSEIPAEALQGFEVVTIKDQHASNCGYRKGSKLHILHRWNSDWLLVRSGFNNLSNLHASYFHSDNQLDLFEEKVYEMQ